MPLGPQIITFGNVQSTFLLTVNLTFVATAANSTVEQSFTVAGLQIGDQVSTVSSQTAYTTNLSFPNSRVSAANTITIAVQNPTAGSLTAPSGTYYIEINRPIAGLPMPIIQ